MSKKNQNILPKMPDAMRKMVEEEVSKQVNGQSKKHSVKKVVIIALAATLLIGTTAFAGMQLIYRLQSEKEGNYGLSTSLSLSEQDSESQVQADIPEEIPVMKIVYDYVPQGMKTMEEEQGKIGFADDFYTGGISALLYLMDTDLPAVAKKRDTDVSFSENVKIAGHDAVYLEKQGIENGSVWFDKKLYILYAENYMIMEMFGGSNITKEEMLKIAEETRLEETGSYIKTETMISFRDADMQETAEGEVRLAASEQEMKGVHMIGDSFQVRSIAGEQGEEINDIEATVQQVQVYDDLSPIKGAEFLPDGWLGAVGTNGKLIANTIQYVKAGDGIDTKDEVLKTSEIGQKLVYFTVEYQNTGSKALKDVMFGMTLMRLTQGAQGYQMYDRSVEEGATGCDMTIDSSVGSRVEMMYFDVRGGERNNNYIPDMQPGEKVTVHMAQIVNEDELDKLYLNLDINGAGYEFSNEALAVGLVDVRQ